MRTSPMPLLLEGVIDPRLLIMLELRTK